MARVEVLVLATGVVEQPEQKHQLDVAAGGRVRQREAARGDATPVCLAVDIGVATPRAGADRPDDRDVEHGDSMTLDDGSR